MASHFKILTVKDIRRETAACVSISFEIPPVWQEEFRYKQGQNITVKTRIGGQEVRRSYSICSSPMENELRIAVKEVAGGRFSAFANNMLCEGEQLEILPPTGAFYTGLDPVNKKNYLAFAAGSGITPVISIIKTTLATEAGSHFTLVYGNCDRSSIIFREQLEGLKNRYIDRLVIHHILSREKMDSSVNYGRIDAGKCQELCEKLITLQNTDDIFICGPGKMIFTVKDWLEQNGFDKRKIHFELFHNPDAGLLEDKEAGGLKKQATVSRGDGEGAVGIGQMGNSRNGDEKGFAGGSSGKFAVPEKEEGLLAGLTSRVTVKLDGVSYDFDLPYDAEPILDAALEQGADLPFSCKSGVCCTCRARLTEGKVNMEVNYALEEDELAAGYILTCQSHPRTERVVIDYDVK